MNSLRNSVKLNPQRNDLFVSQTESSLPAKSGCLTINVSPDCILKQSLVVVFGCFSFSSVFSSPLRSAHATDPRFSQ